jgi:hypothetical protein
MKTRRINQIEIMRYYQKQENDERRRKAASNKTVGFLKKLLGRGWRAPKKGGANFVPKVFPFLLKFSLASDDIYSILNT